MRYETLVILACVGVLASCGSDDPDSACLDTQCTGSPSPVEAGAALGSGSDAGGSALNPAAEAGVNPAADAAGANPGTDASTSTTPDAGVKDAGDTTPAGDGGTTVINMPGARPSAGCGMPAPMSGKTTIDVSGTAREYILSVPQGYDPTKPYRLVFAWHGLGGTADQIARTWYGLASRSMNSTIFVAGQGLNTSNQVGSGPGWDNMGGRDVAFVKALYAKLQGTLCIDETRVFSTGMSYGGIMSNTLGCQMGDVFRAIAPMSGSGPGFGGRATCVGEVAVWMSHGDNDTVVPTASGQASRDFWVKANKCQTQTMPVEPSPCVAYQGCAADLPVTFCLFPGGHTVPAFAAAAIWSFFSKF
jgi:poly(3-hydroxybutyrate) depolymerase